MKKTWQHFPWKEIQVSNHSARFGFTFGSSLGGFKAGGGDITAWRVTRATVLEATLTWWGETHDTPWSATHSNDSTTMQRRLRGNASEIPIATEQNTTLGDGLCKQWTKQTSINWWCKNVWTWLRSVLFFYSCQRWTCVAVWDFFNGSFMCVLEH